MYNKINSCYRQEFVLLAIVIKTSNLILEKYVTQYYTVVVKYSVFEKPVCIRRIYG